MKHALLVEPEPGLLPREHFMMVLDQPFLFDRIRGRQLLGVGIGGAASTRIAPFIFESAFPNAEAHDHAEASEASAKEAIADLEVDTELPEAVRESHIEQLQAIVLDAQDRQLPVWQATAQDAFSLGSYAVVTAAVAVGVSRWLGAEARHIQRHLQR